MHTSLLYHTLGITGYRIVATRLEEHGLKKTIRDIQKLIKSVEIPKSEFAGVLASSPVVGYAVVAIALRVTAEIIGLDNRKEVLAAKAAGPTRKSNVTSAVIIVTIEAKPAENAKRKCRKCASGEVAFRKGEKRLIRCHDIGRLRAFVEVDVRRLRCKSCGHKHDEKIPFLTSPKSRMTRSFEWKVVGMRKNASISSIAEELGLDWRSVKDAEKRVLEAKYKTVDLKEVHRIAIDEIYLFARLKANRKYFTIVRDLDSGRVLNVTPGKGIDALKMFTSRLVRQHVLSHITCVCMDMSNAYYSWVGEHVPQALIVFDHFHVIKKMNDHINNIRRLAMSDINSETRKALRKLSESKEEQEVVRKLMLRIKKRQEKAKKTLKGHRKLLTMNAEKIAKSRKAKAQLNRMLREYEDLNKAYTLKESLRAAYANARTKFEAAKLLKDWIAEARSSGVEDLEAMADTVEEHLEGVLGFWEFRGASNASAEGFNNKIRWLVKQAYGYRDIKYFRLKVFDLPNIEPSRNDF